MSKWWNTEMKTAPPLTMESVSRLFDLMEDEPTEIRPNTMTVRCPSPKCDRLMEVLVECRKCPLCDFAWV